MKITLVKETLLEVIERILAHQLLYDTEVIKFLRKI